MDAKDRLFDQQIHDAYEHVELSEEASERMLAHLLAAQVQAGERSEAGVDSQSQEPQQAEVIRLPGKRKGIPVWLPVAAVVLAALVIVQVSGLTRSKNTEYAQTVAPVQEERADEAISNDMAAGEALVAEGAATVDYSEPSLAELYPLVTLSDGTILITCEEGQYPIAVDEADLGASIGSAVALARDTDGQLACEVFELAGDPGAYAVRYEGEDGCWRCFTEQ